MPACHSQYCCLPYRPNIPPSAASSHPSDPTTRCNRPDTITIIAPARLPPQPPPRAPPPLQPPLTTPDSPFVRVLSPSQVDATPFFLGLRWLRPNYPAKICQTHPHGPKQYPEHRRHFFVLACGQRARGASSTPPTCRSGRCRPRALRILQGSCPPPPPPGSPLTPSPPPPSPPSCLPQTKD